MPVRSKRQGAVPLSATGLEPAGADLRMPPAVIATLGCLIVPHRIVGSALDEAAARAEPT